MTIGSLSAETGVPVETIRYYERIGLLPRPARRAGGFREYDGPDAASRLGFVGRARALGFSLREAGRLLALRDGEGGTSADVRGIAADHLVGLDGQIEALRLMRDALSPLVAACPTEGPVGQCPILAALGGKPPRRGNPEVGSREYPARLPLEAPPTPELPAGPCGFSPAGLSLEAAPLFLSRLMDPSAHTNPGRTHAHMDEAMQRCIQTCLDCLVACEDCADACTGMSGMEACVRLCRDCADLCALCARFMARGSDMHAALCGLCADACDACAAECEQHDHDHCRRCAEACRACAAECRAMATSMA